MAYQVPAVLTVLPPRSLLSFERHTAWQRPGAFVAHSVDVVGVIEASAKVRSHHVFHREAGELTEGPVDIEDRAIRTEDGDGVRYGVHDGPDFLLGSLDFWEKWQNSRRFGRSTHATPPSSDISLNVGRRKTAFVMGAQFKVQSEKSPTAELAVRLGLQSIGTAGFEPATS